MICSKLVTRSWIAAPQHLPVKVQRPAVLWYPLKSTSATLAIVRVYSINALTKHVALRRHFSTSPSANATMIKANPEKDDEGNEMLVEITAQAATASHPIFVQLGFTRLILSLALERDNDKGLKSRSCTSCECHFWWLPRVPILDVFDKPANGVTNEGHSIRSK